MNYLDQLQEVGPVAFVVIGLFAFILLWVAYTKIKGGMHKPQVIKSNQKEKNDAVPEPELDDGEVPGLYIHWVNSVASFDVTRVPKPLGDVYRTALSFAGKVGSQRYLVRERASEKKDKKNKEDEKLIEDYDERKTPYKYDESPEYAYLVNHCADITIKFWSVDVKWWKSTSVWFAAGMMAILFIAFLAYLD